MPSLIRFLVIVAVLAGLAYAAMLAIVATVTPQPREMTQTINPQRLNK
ncbi:oxidoreductase [Methylosinus trichosporium OB3b]|uniref:Oxidoreductase n=1 Tax=Methylosinus trichosporium (strain ATCC 35070 / NCIMB 11131 / UNIQEM 75 / OB3b) TaxID=595536 RepID=A0A2D2D642_METT3|nr:oxidoreductase [Methylosinus trichosporium OB3b]OBS53314.1 oxidoreductase [Methylosinus sp. 3S-1]